MTIRAKLLSTALILAGITAAIPLSNSLYGQKASHNAMQEAKTVQGNTGLTGPVKLCSAVADPYWRDTISVPDGFMAEGCKGYMSSVGAFHYQLGCIHRDSVSWGPLNGGTPSPNCGW